MTPATPFQRVLTRLTSAEMKAILTAQGLLTGSGNDPSSEQTGEAALSWYDWNEGAGSYTATSPAYRYQGGRYPNTSPGNAIQRGRDIRAALETAYNADPTTFLAPLTVLRRTEVTDIANPETSTAGASTPIAIWNLSRYSGVTPPASIAADIMSPIFPFYSSGTPNYTGATAATALAAQAAGRRCIVMGDYAHPYSAFWAICTNSAATNNKYRGSVFNREFDTYNARGILMDTWYTAMLAPGSVWKNFWSTLRSSGGANIVDHLIIDAGEVRQPRFWWLQSSAGPSPALESTSSPPSVTLDTGGTNLCTATAHGMETGQPFKFSSLSGTLPSLNGGQVSSSSVYYARRNDADTFYVHLTPGAALAGTSTRTITGAGATVKYNSYHETLANWFLDSTDWATARTTILKPVLSQAVWDDYFNWDINADERVFLFDAAYAKYYNDKWTDILQVALDEFPNLKISDYNAGLCSAATRSTFAAPNFGHLPYSSGRKIGNLSSHSAYALYDAKCWKWSDLATTTQAIGSFTTAELTWATLVQGVAAMRSVFSADPDNCETWVAPTQGSQNIPEDDDMHSEFSLHMLLPSVSRYGFYNSYVVDDLPTVAQQTQLLNLIAERNAVVAYTPAVLDPQSDLNADYTSEVITTRVWAGGRWVWRVTPRPSVSTTITQNADSVRFVCGSTTLAIGNGRIVSPPTEYAPLGYWVVETVSDTPPYPDASVETAITYRRTSTTEITYTTKRPAETVYSRS